MGRKLIKTEIGKIPEGWELQTFDETFKVLSNNTLPRADLNNREGSVNDIHYGDILTEYGEILNCEESKIPFINDMSLITSSAQLLQDGDFVIADTAEDETVGKAIEVFGIGNKKIVSGLHTIPCRVKKGDFEAKWLGYYLNSPVFHNQLIPYITGIKVSSISKTAIADTYIIVPPVEEQRAIIEIISSLDSIINEEKKIVAKYEKLKEALLSDLFPELDKDEPKLRLPGFNGKWKQVKMLEVLDDMYNGQTPSRYNKDYWNGNINWLSSGELNRGIVLETNEKITDVGKDASNLRIVPKGTFLIAITGLEATGTRGNCAILGIDTTINQSCMALFPNRKKISPRFLFQWYKVVGDKFGRMYAQGTKQQSFTADIIRDFDICYPSIEEQNSIADILENLDDSIKLNKQKLDKYLNVKSGLMNDLFMGRQYQ